MNDSQILKPIPPPPPPIIDVTDVADAPPAYRIYQAEQSGAIYIVDANGQAIGEIYDIEDASFILTRINDSTRDADIDSLRKVHEALSRVGGILKDALIEINNTSLRAPHAVPFQRFHMVPLGGGK